MLMVTADTLGRLEAGLAEAQVFSTHAADPIFDLPPKTYDVRVVRDGSETTTRYWHAPGRGVPTAGLDVLAALPPELRPGSLDAIVAENRSL